MSAKNGWLNSMWMEGDYKNKALDKLSMSNFLTLSASVFNRVTHQLKVSSSTPVPPPKKQA